MMQTTTTEEEEETTSTPQDGCIVGLFLKNGSNVWTPQQENLKNECNVWSL
jgi:hypothetical protein